MKIAMVCDLSIGGAKRHVPSLGRELEKSGNEIEIVSYEKFDGFKTHVLKSAPFLYHYNFLLGTRTLMKTLDDINPDIVHFHHPSGTAEFALRHVKTKFPVVSSVHLAPSPDSLFNLAIGLYYRLLFRQVSRSNKVICVSNFVKNWIINSGITNAVMIPNGVDTKYFKPMKRKTKNHALELLYVGRLTPEKGVITLLNAFTLLEKKMDAGLTIAGAGPLRNLCRVKAKMNDNITFLGELGSTELIRAYSSADLVVVPSLWQEAFGLVLIEAMACETPPIAFRVGAVPEIVKHRKNGFIVDAKTDEALSNGIIAAVDGNLKEIGRYGRRDVMKRYSWKDIADKTQDVYDGIVK